MFALPATIQNGTPEAAAYFDTKRADRAAEFIRRDAVEFDAFDAKGRRHGYTVAFERVEYTRTTEGRGYCLIDDENLGIWFYVRPHATKDGKTFGALQYAKPFRTMEEAEAEGAAMIERARKAATKKH